MQWQRSSIVCYCDRSTKQLFCICLVVYCFKVLVIIVVIVWWANHRADSSSYWSTPFMLYSEYEILWFAVRDEVFCSAGCVNYSHDTGIWRFCVFQVISVLFLLLQRNYISIPPGGMYSQTLKLWTPRIQWVPFQQARCIVRSKRLSRMNTYPIPVCKIGGWRSCKSFFMQSYEWNHRNSMQSWYSISVQSATCTGQTIWKRLFIIVVFQWRTTGLHFA